MSIAKPRNASLIDTLSTGFRTLHRRVWVMLVPAGLSAYLWLSAPIMFSLTRAQLQLGLTEVARLLSDDAADSEAWVRSILESDLRVVLAWLNVVPVLPPLAGVSTGVQAKPLLVSGSLPMLLAIVAINSLALLLSSLFLTLLSEAVRGERGNLLASMRQTGRVATAILLYLLTLAGLGLVLALPFLAISAILITTLPGSTLPILLLWYVALFWAYIYTGFAPEAISISSAGPLRAIYHSVHVVRRNLAATLGLLLLSFVIANGLGVIWRQLASTPPGLALAILGSAYVGSGLAAARMVFYREHVALQPGPRYTN